MWSHPSRGSFPRLGRGNSCTHFKPPRRQQFGREHTFRNRDIRGLLFPGGKLTAAEAKRRSARVTRLLRLLRLLRAHRLIAKVPKTHRYQVTESGRAAISGLLAADRADLKRLLQAA
jgi:hypothetical protein